MRENLFPQNIPILSHLASLAPVDEPAAEKRKNEKCPEQQDTRQIAIGEQVRTRPERQRDK